MLLDGQKANFMKHLGVNYWGVGLGPTSLYVIIIVNFKEEKLMNYSIFRFTLNMHNHRSQAMVKVFQGDTAVKLIITLTDGGNVYKIREGNVATLTGTKADGSKITHSCTITDNTIIYLFDEETADTAGLVTCEITLYNENGGVITAPKFTIDVDEKEVSGDEPISEYSAEAIATVMGAAAKEFAREQAEKAREINEANRQESYTEAKDIAEEAKQAATNAVNTANTAKTISEDAKSKAETAESNSSSAVSTASNANKKATAANMTAEQAEDKADEAKTIANEAKDILNNSSFSYNHNTGELTLSYTYDGETKKKTIDLPLESTITNIEESKRSDGRPILIFTLQNGNKTEVLLDDIFDIVKGNKQYIENVERIAIENKTDISTLKERATKSESDISALDERLYNNEQYTEGINHTLNDLTDSGYGLIPELQRTVDNHEERIEQLESLSLRYIEDTSVWHAKDVPSDVGKKALVDMIGGMSHTSNNKLPFPYPNMYDNEQNGVSVTYNKDGSITLNGVLKAPNQIDILLYEDYSNPLSVDGVFTIGVDLPEACSFLSVCELSDEGLYDNPEQFDYPQEVEASLMWKFHYLQISFGAWAEKDVTFDNYTFYPMYNEGRTPLKFEPYIEGVKHAKVKAIRSMVDGKVLSSVEVPKEIYDRADWGLGVSAEACNYIDLENDAYHSDYVAYTFNGSEQWNDPAANGKKRFSCALGNLGYALPHFIDNRTVTSAISNGYTSVSASANYNQRSKSFAFGRTSLFVFDENIQDLDAWLEHLRKNPLTVVYEKAVKDVIKLSGIAQEDKILVMDTDKGKLIADNDENLPAPSTITYVVHRGL